MEWQAKRIVELESRSQDIGKGAVELLSATFCAAHQEVVKDMPFNAFKEAHTGHCCFCSMERIIELEAALGMLKIGFAPKE